MEQYFGSRGASFVRALTLIGVWVSAIAMPVEGAVLNLSYSTTYNGTSIVTTPPSGTGSTTALNNPGSYTYGNTFNGPTIKIPGTPGIGYGFYDDFVFTVTGATASSITTTIDLGNLLQITNLQERLYKAAGNSIPTFGPPVGGAIHAWTSPIGSSGLVTVLPTTMLDPGTYVLEIRGNVTGGAGGSYAGVFNTAPAVVPIPAALPLLLSGLGGLGILGRRRRPKSLLAQ